MLPPDEHAILGIAGGRIKPIPGLETYEKFLMAPIEEQERMLREKPVEWWEEEGAKKALAVFHAAAERVTAYKGK